MPQCLIKRPSSQHFERVMKVAKALADVTKDLSFEEDKGKALQTFYDTVTRADGLSGSTKRAGAIVVAGLLLAMGTACLLGGLYTPLPMLGGALYLMFALPAGYIFGVKQSHYAASENVEEYGKKVHYFLGKRYSSSLPHERPEIELNPLPPVRSLP